MRAMSYFFVQVHGTELNLWIVESNIQRKEVRTKFIKILYSQDLDNKFSEHKFRKMNNIFDNGLLWLRLALFQYTFTGSSSFPIHFGCLALSQYILAGSSPVPIHFGSIQPCSNTLWLYLAMFQYILVGSSPVPIHLGLIQHFSNTISLDLALFHYTLALFNPVLIHFGWIQSCSNTVPEPNLDVESLILIPTSFSFCKRVFSLDIYSIQLSEIFFDIIHKYSLLSAVSLSEMWLAHLLSDI